MKKQHLEELVRYITKQVVKEYLALDADNQSGQDSNINTSDTSMEKPVDAMSSVEKEKIRKQQDLAKQQDLKKKQVELDSKKKEIDFNKKKLDQMKRFDIPNLNKSIQQSKKEI